jgi:hypothetical protein
MTPGAPACRELACPARAQFRRDALHLGSGPAFWRRASTMIETARMKKPGAVSRPGTAREFQFQE